MTTEEKELNLFDEQEEKSLEGNEEKDLEVHDDLKEGMMAESDPKSKVVSPTDKYSGPAEDVIKKGLDGQLTVLGRKTAEILNKMPKFKIVVPTKELNPKISDAIVGINGWNIHIKRGVPVMLPDPVIELLANAGENPTVVR